MQIMKRIDIHCTTMNSGAAGGDRAEDKCHSETIVTIYFAETEVCQNHVAFLVQQDILQFDVAIEYFEVVQMVQCHGDFRHVEERLILVEMLSHVEMREKFSAPHEVQNQVQTRA